MEGTMTQISNIFARDRELEKKLAHFADCPPDIAAEFHTLDEAKVDTTAESIEDVILKVIELEKYTGEGWEARLARSIRFDLERLVAGEN
jgi:hypothetical protein